MVEGSPDVGMGPKLGRRNMVAMGGTHCELKRSSTAPVGVRTSNMARCDRTLASVVGRGATSLEQRTGSWANADGTMNSKTLGSEERTTLAVGSARPRNLGQGRRLLRQLSATTKYPCEIGPRKAHA